MCLLFPLVVGVSNMPTPEYSDDGARCPTPMDDITSTLPGTPGEECEQRLDCVEIPESNEMPSEQLENNSLPDCNERSDSSQTQEQSVISEVTAVVTSLETEAQEKEK